MGSYHGKRIPDNYDPWWEERDYEEEQSHWYWWHLGYQDGHRLGYDRGLTESEEITTLKQRIESLEGLISANVRVIKEELKTEMANGVL